jgi:membrane protease YdiL (CAAX protease family)
MNIFKNQIIVAAARIIMAALLGLFVLMIRPSLEMSLQNLPVGLLSSRWISEFVSFAVSLVISIVIIAALSKGKISTYGFKKTGDVLLAGIAVISLGIGIVTTLVGTFVGLEGPAFMEGYSFVHIVVSIWIYASVYEEVVARGLFQSFLSPLAKYGFTITGLRVSLPVLLSALFFALSHMALLTTGADAYYVIYIVIFAFIVGLMAAYYREKSESLIPAIVIHMLANIGGTCIDYLIDLF